MLSTQPLSPCELDPFVLWYVADRRLGHKSSADKAIRVADWATSGYGLDTNPDEETLFIALHTCAYHAGRQPRSQKITMNERMKWARRWQVIREKIVESNLGLVYSMIGRFGTKTLDEDDLLSDALLSLTRAADRFNPWRGYRFSTYACNVIARALMRRGRRESNYRRIFPIQHDASFERPMNLPDAQSELYVERLHRAIDENLGDLTNIESRILAQRFPPDRQRKLTFQQIGKTVGLSKERVRQIQNIALSKLREVLETDPVLQ